MRKYIWTYPIIVMFVTTVLAMFLQSCGVVELNKMHNAPSIEELDKIMRASSIMWGGTLLLGACICIYIYVEAKKLEIKITKQDIDRG